MESTRMDISDRKVDQPNYVLKANEGVIVPKFERLGTIRVVVWSIVGIIILGSLVFQDNLFGELSWTARMMLVVLALLVTFIGNKMVPSPIEIQFFDDYLIVYREKHYYSRKNSKKEFNKFYYRDIKVCKYRKASEKINIIGVGEFTWYDYNTDGSLPENPTFHKKGEGITWFYTSEDPEVDFVSAIENNSPLKVMLEES